MIDRFQDGKSPTSITVELESSTIQLGDVLLDSVYLNNRAYKGPDNIDLGEYDEWIESLMAWTEAHPDRHEAGGVILLEPVQGLIKPSDLIPGFKHGVEFTRSRFLDYQLSKTNMFYSAIGADAHSHPAEIPFSSIDFTNILLGDDERAAAISAIVITPRSKYIAFRGERTPAMSRDEAQLEAKEKSAEFRARAQSWPGADSSPFLAAMGEIVEFRAVFHELCRDWDLQVFRGRRDERVLHRWTYEQMEAEVQELRKQATSPII